MNRLHGHPVYYPKMTRWTPKRPINYDPIFFGMVTAIGVFSLMVTLYTK